MYRTFFTVIVIFLAVASLCFSFFKPEMHKSVMIYDSSYTLVQPQQETETIKNIPTQTNSPKPVAVTQKAEQTTFNIPQKTVYKPQTLKQATNIKQEPVKNTVKIVEAPKIVQQTVKKEVEPVQQTLTQAQKEQQELILWNKWRSNLQNQIMTDTKLPILPEGTAFKFSFDVDKFGRVSNVQTWSLTPAYTPYAIQHIAPVIRSYQGRSILDFPQGSNRTSTTVTGGWKIAKTAKFSTPDDYKDTEKVMK